MTKKQQTFNASRRNFITKSAAAGVAATTLGGLEVDDAHAQQLRWDSTADVVVIGSGAAGMPAAIAAADAGASVIVVEANFDIGGHQMLNGGMVVLGGGTSLQKKYGIEDSPDQVFLDHTNPDHPMTRYNDREIARTFADHNAEVFEFLVANGVKFADRAPTPATVNYWGNITTGRSYSVAKYSDNLKETIGGAGGSGLSRPLEQSARKKGVKFLLSHRMTRVIRENPQSGRVVGITADFQGKTINIQARKGVVIATGGHHNDVNIRRIFDPRLTDEGYQVWGEPYVGQTGDGQRAAMAIGATLWATANQTRERNLSFMKPNRIGTQYAWGFPPDSPIFHMVRAQGLFVRNWDSPILVNQLGQRFWNEQEPNWYGDTEASFGYLAGAVGSVVTNGENRKERLGGPSWAIFDAEAVKRENWNVNPPMVDPAGYFFKGDTLTELARNIRNPHQKIPMSGATLQETVTRYNSFVDSGKDGDFGKPNLRYRIQTPPFYAAWATPGLHDSVSGLRINGKTQVVDLTGQVIPHLYAAGECSGGLGIHGQARCMVIGYVAGKNAAAERA